MEIEKRKKPIKEITEEALYNWLLKRAEMNTYSYSVGNTCHVRGRTPPIMPIEEYKHILRKNPEWFPEKDKIVIPYICKYDVNTHILSFTTQFVDEEKIEKIRRMFRILTKEIRILK
jgi:hypothetical protein